MVARCFRYRYGQGFNDRPFTFCSLRFHKILVIYPKGKVPFVKRTYFLEQTCSVIFNSIIFFLKQALLSWHVPYIFMTPLLSFQANFFLFLQQVFILKSSKFFWCYTAQYFLLYSGMTSKSIRYSTDSLDLLFSNQYILLYLIYNVLLFNIFFAFHFPIKIHVQILSTKN